MYYNSFIVLIKYLNNLGWYSGEIELIKYKMLGQFEGYSGRASETWEHKHEIEIQEIPELGIPYIKKSSPDLEKLCNEIIKEINAKVEAKEEKRYKGEF